MLKTLRVLLALFSITAITLLFLDFTGTAVRLWPWMASIQFIPALLSLNFVILFMLVIGTLLFGRVYCSVVCPLGIWQDVVNWVRNHVGSRKGRLHRLFFTPEKRVLRLVVLTVFVVLMVLGLTNMLANVVASLLEPYSAYGRIASSIFAPAWDGANNLLASWAESRGSYAFYRVATIVSVPVLAVAIITLIVVTVMAWRGGRDYCNTICPVGTILSFLARFSVLRPVIDTEKCVGCRRCEKNCKAKCIDSKHHRIDYTRCVACMDCIDTCSEGAIKYTWRHIISHTADDDEELATEPTSEHTPSGPDSGRRAFVTGLGIIAGAMATDMLAKTTDGGLTELRKKDPVQRRVPILPPGAGSIIRFSRLCTACQLCVSVCRNGIIRPSTDLDRLMQPELDFTDGYCTPDCNACGSVCPAEAILPIELDEKAFSKIGTATVDLDACLSANGTDSCGSCARHCPVGAIQMVEMPSQGGRLSPVVNAVTCIGCGACEYHCPVGTIAAAPGRASAIHVEGVEIQHIV